MIRGGLNRGLRGSLLLLALSAMVDTKPAARASLDPKPEPPPEPTPPPAEAARPSATVTP